VFVFDDVVMCVVVMYVGGMIDWYVFCMVVELFGWLVV